MTLPEAITYIRAWAARFDKLDKKATPGPWKYDSHNMVFGDNWEKLVCTIPDHPKQDEWFDPEQSTERSVWYAESGANAQLIATLRNSAPALVKAVLEMCCLVEHQWIGSVFFEDMIISTARALREKEESK